MTSMTDMLRLPLMHVLPMSDSVRNIHSVREVFVIHVGGTRCVTWSLARSIQIHARITWGVALIRANFVHLFL